MNEECFIDATFVMAKGGAVGNRTNKARIHKGHENHGDCGSRMGWPLSVSTHAANHHERPLGAACFDFYMIEAKPDELDRRSRL